MPAKPPPSFRALREQLNSNDPNTRSTAVRQLVSAIEAGDTAEVSECDSALRHLAEGTPDHSDARAIALIFGVSAAGRNITTKKLTLDLQLRLADCLLPWIATDATILIELVEYLTKLVVAKHYSHAHDLAAKLRDRTESRPVLRHHLQSISNSLFSQLATSNDSRKKTPAGLLREQLDELRQSVLDQVEDHRSEDALQGSIDFTSRQRFVAFGEILDFLGPLQSNQSKILEHMERRRLPAFGKDGGNLLAWVNKLNRLFHRYLQRRKGEHTQSKSDDSAPLTGDSECHLVEIGTTFRLTPLGLRVWRMWQRRIQEEAAEYQLIAGEAEKPPAAKRTIVVAAGDMVRSYLLPYAIEQFRQAVPGVSIRLAEYRRQVIFEQVESGAVDLCLGWDLPDHHQHPDFELRVLDGTETEACVILPPDHALAKGVGPDRELAAVHPDRLCGEAVVHPSIPPLDAMAREMCGAAESTVMSLPALAYHVTATKSVGLIPGWVWVRRELERRFHLRSAHLQQGDETLPSLGLRTLSLRTGVRIRETPVVDHELVGTFIRCLRDALKGLNREPWVTQELQATGKEFSGTWHFYYVTEGPNSGSAVPEWCHSGLTWSRSVKDAPLSGTIRLGLPFGSNEGRLTVRGELVRWGQGHDRPILMLTTFHEATLKPGVAYFADKVMHGDMTPYDICLGGIYVCRVITARATASPVLLSNREIPLEWRQQFVRQNLVSLQTPEMAGDPLVSE